MNKVQLKSILLGGLVTLIFGPAQASMMFEQASFAGNASFRVEATDVYGNIMSPCSKSLQVCTLTITALTCNPVPAHITITNTSPTNINALSITASSSNSNFTTYVVQNNNCPAQLLPNASCTISFYSNSNVDFSAIPVNVSGTNTAVVTFDIQSFLCG